MNNKLRRYYGIYNRWDIPFTEINNEKATTLTKEQRNHKGRNIKEHQTQKLTKLDEIKGHFVSFSHFCVTTFPIQWLRKQWFGIKTHTSFGWL